MTNMLPEDKEAREAVIESATERLETTRRVAASAEATHERSRIEEAQAALREAEAAHDEATAPVNYPVNYVFHKNGCAMVSYSHMGALRKADIKKRAVRFCARE